MKLPARSVAWLLPFLLTACIHNPDRSQVQQPLAPPIEDAPPPKPAPPPTDLPPTVITIPNQTPVADTSAAAQKPEEHKPPVKHKKPVPVTTQQASTGAPSVSAIGQLTTGDPADLRGQTEGSIAEIERGLNGIGRKFSDQEQKTAGQIREFLKQARAALASGDMEGAHTLAAKAKVLLGELRR